MREKKSGYLIIADISGYTRFLHESELEPAAEHLISFLDLLIQHTRPPLVISRLEGDAIISYALQGSFIQGQTLVDLVEDAYIVFRQTIELAIINNSCDCHACHNISKLDLKFFVHYGAFIIQPLGAYQELVGNDVNLVHRLTKNTIPEQTGAQAYAAYTQAAVNALGIQEQSRYMISHEEHYEDIGRVSVYVQDMHHLWQQTQSQRYSPVAAEDALVRVEKSFPVSSALVWDYVTKPENMALLSGSTHMHVDNRIKGRVGPGAIYQCEYGGKATITYTLVSWEPFKQYTFESERPCWTRGHTTLQLTPLDDGTTVSILVGKSEGGISLLRKVSDLVYRPVGRKQVQAGINLLYDQMNKKFGETPVIRPA